MTERLGLWRIADDRPDDVAVLDAPEGTWTYGELARSAHRIVHALRRLGAQDGDAIAVMAPNGVLPIRISLACQEAGWNIVLINSYWTANEIATVLEHSRARVLVLHEAYAAVLDGEAGARVRNATTVLGVGAVPDVLDLERLAAAESDLRPDDRREGGTVSYSSGTTGAPKAILRAGGGGDPDEGAQRAALTARAVEFEPFGGPYLVSTAMYHGGSHGYCMRALHLGHALVIMPRFDPAEVLAKIERFRVRTAFMVPTQFHRLLQLPETVRRAADVSSLRSVVHTAAPCPVPVKRSMIEWWGPVIWEIYGGMEGVASVVPSSEWLERPGTVGRAAPGVRLSIVDDEGRELGPNEVGHIYYATAAQFSYMFDEAQTRAAYRDDRFTIGDIGFLDEDGYLFISDRAKDMIISGGVNIFPAEIEAVLLEHPAVADVAVLGIPDEEWGEQVLAFVELAASHDESDALGLNLIEHCADRLASYKRPRRIEFAQHLPRTEAGKMYKRSIRDQYLKRSGPHSGSNRCGS